MLMRTSNVVMKGNYSKQIKSIQKCELINFNVFFFLSSVVEFASYNDMKTAIEKLDETELNGRRVRLVEDRGGRGGGSGNGTRRGRSRSSSSRSRSRSRRRSHSR